MISKCGYLFGLVERYGLVVRVTVVLTLEEPYGNMKNIYFKKNHDVSPTLSKVVLVSCLHV